MADEKEKTEELENEEVEDQDGSEKEKEEDSEDKKTIKDDKSGSNKGGKTAEGKTFTQDQVNRMMTKEKNQGRLAALKELGIDPKDTKAVNMVKALIESQKTDEQKAAEKKSEDEAKVAEANQRALIAEAKAEAMLLGVKAKFVDDVVTLATTKMTDDSDLKTIIGEFKMKYPIWFGEDSEDGEEEKDKTGKKGTGSSVKTNKNDKSGSEKSLGARLAAQRKSSNKKSNYWGKANR